MQSGQPKSKPPIDDEKQKPQRAKKNKPIIVEYMWENAPFEGWRKWTTYGWYRDTETANKVIETEQRKRSRFKMRIKK